MIHLPPLNDATIVRVTREGGIAYLPGLARPRSFQLGDCTEELRRQIDDALQSAAPHAEESSATSPGGDQRIYRVEVVMENTAAASSVSFDVPETEAPAALVHLWKDAGKRR